MDNCTIISRDNHHILELVNKSDLAFTSMNYKYHGDVTLYNESYFQRDMKMIVPQDQPHLGSMERIIYSYVVGSVCVVGLLGNMMNIVVLTSRSLRGRMEQMEKSVYTGLGALAVSDMMFCLCALIHAYIGPRRTFYSQFNFEMFLHTYNSGIMNTFILSSTWMTVAMASSRYVAICHPIRARTIIGMTFTKWSLVCIFFMCMFINVPRFWEDEIRSYRCLEGGMEYYVDTGPFRKSKFAYLIYSWCYFVVGIILPFTMLSFCNIHLMKALRDSHRMRRRYRRNNHIKDPGRHLTLTLVIIVITYIVLVTPAEIIVFLRDLVISTEELAFTQAYNHVLAITNMMQSINFAFNFILYCIVNVKFRSVIKLMCGKMRGGKMREGKRATISHGVDCSSFKSSTSARKTAITEM